MRLVKDNERITLLRQVWLFESCTDRELRELATITTPLLVDAGRVLAREGDPGTDCSVVAEGQASATIEGEEIATIGPGSFFGEMALLDGTPRVATITALTPMLLLVLSRTEFDQLLERAVPSVERKMLTVLAQRLRLADERAKLHVDRLSGW